MLIMKLRCTYPLPLMEQMNEKTGEFKTRGKESVVKIEGKGLR